MKQEFNFIKTQDKETSEKLIASGLKLVTHDESGWVFFVGGRRPLNFEADTLRNVIFTNSMIL